VFGVPGLETAAWVTVDDPARATRAANGFCTQIGNEHFTWFGTTRSKSRLNFLELLRAGHADYVINTEALAYMRGRCFAGWVIRLATEHDESASPIGRHGWRIASARRRRLDVTPIGQIRHRGRAVGQHQSPMASSRIP